MHEILQSVSASDWVLDLGSGTGSFPAGSCRGFVVRADIEFLPGRDYTGSRVRCDASRLPFRDETFTAVVANHSLEHFIHPSEALSEVGRVLDRQGALYVAVPDASTLADRFYRWLAGGAGT